MNSDEPSREAVALKAIRKALDLSQGGFADLLQVRPNTVGRWERGERSPEFTFEQVITLDSALRSIGRRVSDYIEQPPAGETAGGH